MAVSPTAPWQILDHLDIGASIDVLYAEARLTNAAVELQGDDVEVGFPVGALLVPRDGTRFGVAYHASYSLRLEGENTSSRLPGDSTFEAEAKADLPAFVQLGITQKSRHV